MLHVQRAELGLKPPAKPVLQVTFGWEPIDFYAARVGGDRHMGAMMKGPAIDPMSPACDYGTALLELIEQTCLSSPEYVERLQRHYQLFKEALP